MLKKEERWTAIDFQYMTEESDGEEQVRQHKLPWRSEGRLVVCTVSAVMYNTYVLFSLVLNRLVKKLDARIEKTEKAGGFKSKEKLISSVSLLEPPPDAPDWAIQQS